MVNVALRPPPKDPETILTYLWTNFTRVADAFGSLKQISEGVNSVTGLLDIDTGIPDVYAVTATMAGVPASGAAFVRAFPLGGSRPSEIRIQVYRDTFVQSTIARNISWIAVGR